jgi:hypothetical protein
MLQNAIPAIEEIQLVFGNYTKFLRQIYFKYVLLLIKNKVFVDFGKYT